MLYHVKFNLDRQALSAIGDLAIEVSQAEGRRAEEMKQQGRLMGLWRYAAGGGAMFVLDAESHDALNKELASLPLWPYLSSVEITPLLPHPMHPEFGEVRPRSAGAQ